MAGTVYAGWQLQPNATTIQGTVEAALAAMCGRRADSVSASGRTDAGVHAEMQVVGFQLPVRGPFIKWSRASTTTPLGHQLSGREG